MSSKTALVTGAGSGGGRAAAPALLDRGYIVWLLGWSAADLEQTRERTGAVAPFAHVPLGDVADRNAVGALFRAIAAKANQGAREADGTGETAPAIDTRHIADAVYMAGLPLEAKVQFMTG